MLPKGTVSIEVTDFIHFFRLSHLEGCHMPKDALLLSGGLEGGQTEDPILGSRRSGAKSVSRESRGSAAT